MFIKKNTKYSLTCNGDGDMAIYVFWPVNINFRTEKTHPQHVNSNISIQNFEGM